MFIVAGLILAAVGFEIGDAWPYHAGSLLGWMGIVVSAVAAIRQYREQRPFEYDFYEQSWKALDDEFVLEIPKSLHGKGKTPAEPTVLMAREAGEYEPVYCGVSVTASGTVRIFISSKPFHGRLVIK